MPEDAKCVDHSQKLKDMGGVVPLRRRQLAALIGHRVLLAVIIGLRQDSRHGKAAGVCCQHRSATRIEGSQHWCGGEGHFQRVETRLRRGRPYETSCRAPECRQRCSDLSVPFNETTIVIGKSRETAHLRSRSRCRPLPYRLHLARVNRDPIRRQAMPQEAELRAAKFALRALGIKLPAAEDLEHLLDVEQMLF